MALLRRAHAGERAAALAYRGHARIARDRKDRQAIVIIEADEWRHRDELRLILDDFGSRPSPFREYVMMLVGHTVSIGCFLCGFALATYFAAVLEATNVAEYELAADLANGLARPDLEAAFRRMARTEAEHERVLRGMLAPGVCGHRAVGLTENTDPIGPEN